MQLRGNLGYLASLGQGYGAAIGAATSLISAATAKKKPTSAQPSMGAPSPSSTTVSPVIQTKISPQISPVFSQIQDSAGASTYGAPTMTSSGAQTAETGMPPPGAIPPSMRSRTYNPYDEYGRPQGAIPYYPPEAGVFQQAGGYQDLVKWGIIGAIGLFAIKSFQKPGGVGSRKASKTYTTTDYKRLS